MLKLISGTWGDGNSLTIHDTKTDNYYHVVVYKDSIVIGGKVYRKEDIKTKEA